MHSATYNLHNNFLYLYLDQNERIPKDEYAGLKKLGLAWWPGSRRLAGVWTPEREDAILRYVEEIECIVDDDTGLVYRLERFANYTRHARARAESEESYIRQLTEHIPLGQPILVGHHSERGARRVQRLVDSAMRRKIWEQDKSEYWQQRQAAAQRHAAYKERPDVIYRRIERFEADLRRWEREVSDEGRILWAIRNPQGDWQAHELYCWRWIEHLHMVLDYQRELYARSGGTPVDRGDVVLEKGGAIQNRYPPYWVPIWQVNPKSVTVLDTYNWEPPFAHVLTRTVKKAEITRALTAEAYRRHEHYALGQELIAVYEKLRTPDEKIHKGGAVRIRYTTGGGVTGWMHVVRPGKQNLTVLDWSPYNGGKWYQRKIPHRDVSDIMSPGEWSAHIETEKQKGEDPRWEKLSQTIK